MHDYLKEILKHKQREVIQLHQQIAAQPDSLLAQIYHGQQKRLATKSFKKALNTQSTAVIAEIKRKSPSKDHIGDIADPVKLADAYTQAEAAAISILTDRYGFNGSLDDLTQVKMAVIQKPQPILRKDFILDAAQIAESVVAGADAILLIVAILKDKTRELLEIAKKTNIDALVEVHDRQELNYAVSIGAEIIGVNNRNLTTFEVDINNAKNLFPHIPRDVISVAESGITNPEIAAEFAQMGYYAILVGEALVKSSSPAAFIKQMRIIKSDALK